MSKVKWAELTPDQRDQLVYEKVMGKQPEACEADILWDHGIWHCLTCGIDGTRHESTEHVRIPTYTKSMDAAWQIVDKMHDRQEREHFTNDFVFDGPHFKPSHEYLTAEGYPLGTTCWYVHLAVDDLNSTVCAQKPQEAICLAGLQAVGIEVEEG